MLSTINETNSWYIDENIKTYIESGKVNTSDPGFQESNQMRCKIKENFLIRNIL